MVTSRRRRALGQHFLSNRSAALRIVDLFAPLPGARVLEIGPGRGALTAPLLEAGARVIAVELDRRLAEGLRERFGDRPGFTLVESDILRCDLSALAQSAGPPLRVLANLPYSITGPVLMKLFGAAPVLSDMTLMLQREVVARLVAQPGTRAYGSLSVLAQYFTEPRHLMRLEAGSFTPPPAVLSSVVAMPFRTGRELTAAQEEAYPPFVRRLFARRRRTLHNNLKGSAGPPGDSFLEPERLLAEAGIDGGRRPETLSREECIKLYLASRRGLL
ncbi:MAG TPA: 16S rRNA (adenine(1518)-N(6)/adenine(1519)-N(6))-dimethyltransferase RsmA [Candidatus Polarisedimenticolia bacterium]|nr:16S rRNA (adenine(1518)-N(6)/adenine(1519)-N(6))-dimethyltransferase RsmA [Candidatus Polarisedimenticolia bacterium]